MINAADHRRGNRKHRAMTGKTTATMMRRYPIHSGFSKLGVTPGGGGIAGMMVPSEAMVDYS